jgi:Holliday junction resolvasome RuvABC endonuclease subunit
MSTERVLALDVSSKTGWCLILSHMDGSFSLEAYGQVPKIPCPDEKYPDSYVTWAYLCYDPIEKLFNEYAPDVLVVEETTKSKNSFSQKILEFAHFLLAKLIKETGIKNVYLQTGEWRKQVGSYMNNDEKKRNKEITRYKEEHGTKLARDKSNKVIGKITKKHVSIRRANEIFGSYFKTPLRKKDEDAADALCIGMAYHLKRMKGYCV